MLEQKFYTCEVRLYSDKYYTTNIKLSDNTYRLDFRYNAFAERYYLSVFDSANRALASNKEVERDRFFSFQPYDAKELCLQFVAIYPNRDINYEKWSDNMLCLACLTRWESVVSEGIVE